MASVKRTAALLCVATLTTSAAAGQTSLSIYSDGRVVVRRTLPQSLEKGRNALTLDLAGADPATVFSPDTAVTLVSTVLRRATERGPALESAVGQTLSFVRAKGDTVRATVVRASPPQYRLPDGRLLLVEPGEPLFPPELVRTTSQAALVLAAGRPRPTTELAWVTQGATWYAVYQVVIGSGGGQAAVSGAATLVSQALRADSAAVQLVAGTINRVRSPVSRQFAPSLAGRMVLAAEAAPLEAGEEAVGETHVYTLPARVTLEPGVSVVTALFPRALVPATQEYIVPGVLPLQGYVSDLSGSPEHRVPVQVWYLLKRAHATSFGDRPLPGGIVQLYQADSAGRVQLVGEAASGHTAPGRDLRVQSGDAFDVTAERVQTDYTQEQLPAIRRGLPTRQRFTASYRVTLSNAKPDPVTVDVRETRAGSWVVVTSSVPAEKLSATEVRFRLAVPAKGEATLTYTVQVDS
jgi:hypothetical protein